MSDKNTGGPAFPAPTTKPLENYYPGMTLRDYFAASFVSSGHIFKYISPGDRVELVAQQAYMMADAMLKEREL